DYEPTIFYPKRSPDPLYRDFTTQCEKMDIPFLSYLPTEGGTCHPCPLSMSPQAGPCPMVPPLSLSVSPQVGPCPLVPPVSTLGVPAGWAAEAGGSGGISPDVLVSLAAPKECARRFLGRQHFVAGRFLPYDVQRKFELNPPEYPGTECVVAL
ncbi:YJEN3 protein, partial [Edolisoma coerulescens]|nr:YJEN3 protein [Edolisoma coerulescens]